MTRDFVGVSTGSTAKKGGGFETALARLLNHRKPGVHPEPRRTRPPLLRLSTTRMPPGLDKLDHQKGAEVSRRRWRASSTTASRRTSPRSLRLSTTHMPPGLDKLDHQYLRRASSTTEERMPGAHPDPRRTSPRRCAFRPPACRQVSTSSTTSTSAAPFDHPHAARSRQARPPVPPARLLDHRSRRTSPRSLRLSTIHMPPGLDKLDHQYRWRADTARCHGLDALAGARCSTTAGARPPGSTTTSRVFRPTSHTRATRMNRSRPPFRAPPPSTSRGHLL